MATEIRKKTVEVDEKVWICDICKIEIALPSECTCRMCERDVHPPGHLGCSQYARDDDDYIVCRVCWKLGKAYRSVVKRCNVQIEVSYTRWQDACNDHRYDDD